MVSFLKTEMKARTVTAEIHSLLCEAQSDLRALKSKIAGFARNGWKKIYRLYHTVRFEEFSVFANGTFKSQKKWVADALKYFGVSLKEFVDVIVLNLERYPDYNSPHAKRFFWFLFFLTLDARLERFLKFDDEFLDHYLIFGMLFGGKFAQWLDSKGLITPENILKRIHPQFRAVFRELLASSQINPHWNAIWTRMDRRQPNLIWFDVQGRQSLMAIDRLCKAVKKYLPVSIEQDTIKGDGTRVIGIRFGR